MFAIFTEAEKATASRIATDLTDICSGFVEAYRIVKPYAVAAWQLTAEYSAIVYKDLAARVTAEDVEAAKAFCLDLMSLAFVAGLYVRERLDEWIESCEVCGAADTRQQLRQFDTELETAPVKAPIALEDIAADDPAVEPAVAAPSIAPLHFQPARLLLLPPAKAPIGLLPTAKQQPATPAKLTPKDLRNLCQQHGIKWRNAMGRNKHMSTAEMRQRLAEVSVAV